ncbi:unnamed protein product [Gongylonema pulchrum]|uniref:Vps53_N domain-containing protein n=1 Tax=Gongylonema pulchrum TaxID=637853 RepID=A0A183EI18_9BILA|nr:unnamed protein product [Gongylonema pulchrum]
MAEVSDGSAEVKKSTGLEVDEDEITFSDKVAQAIDGIGHSELCRADVDVIDQINRLFPTEQSLSQLDTVMRSIEDEIVGLDSQLAELVETHGEAGIEGDQALCEAHSSMEDLEERVRAICLKTRSSESVVQEMTRDIKQLDVAKRNLIASIKTLHHLQILLTGHRYSDIASQLPAVLNVLQLFGPYMEVEHIKNVAEQLERLKQRLAIQLVADLKRSFQASFSVFHLLGSLGHRYAGLQISPCFINIDCRLAVTKGRSRLILNSVSPYE